MPTNEHYDVVIIGSGAGGGTLAWKLAPSGKRILLLERGGYLPRERDNWDTTAVFLQGKYSTDEEWRDRKGDEFTPEQNYYVGGNTKFYGAALLRLRPEDFGEITHHGGISPAWPLSYQDLDPWYTEAERLYFVHGQAGEDPTDGPRSADYPYPAIKHEPRIQQLHDDLVRLGLHPSHLPVGAMLDQEPDGAAAHQPLHPLRPPRWLSVSRRRQGGLPDGVRRPCPGRALQSRARHERQGRAARDGRRRPAGYRGRRHDGRRLRSALLG